MGREEKCNKDGYNQKAVPGQDMRLTLSVR